MTIQTREKPTAQDYDNALLRWREHPEEYISDRLLSRLGITLEPRQIECLQKVFKHRKVLIPTHFAFGKSFLGALICITIANLYPLDCVGSTFAPTFRQIEDILWREMRKVFDGVNAKAKILAGKMLSVRYVIGNGCLVSGFAPKQNAKGADVGGTVQGKHAEVVFIFIDEMGGMSKQILDQIEFLESSGKIVYVIGIGNPLSPNTAFGQLCLTEAGEDYEILAYDAYSAPNMIANGLTSQKAIMAEGDRLRAMKREERKEWLKDFHYKRPFPTLLSPGFVMARYLRWGWSALFISRCIGKFADAGENVLIPLARANEVMLGTYTDSEGVIHRESEEKQYAKYNGIKDIFAFLDCADEGADTNHLFALRGNMEAVSKTFSKTYAPAEADYRGTRMTEDGPYIAKWIFENVIEPNKDFHVTLGIDCTGGFGNSVYDSIMAMPLNRYFTTIVKFKFGLPAHDEELYHDNIAEMAWMLKNSILSSDGLLLEPDEDLLNQMTSRKTETDGKLRNKLESKKDYKVHAGQSPDKFDALMGANYMRTYVKSGDMIDKIKQSQDEYAEVLEAADRERNW